jgi:hypothetical protein
MRAQTVEVFQLQNTRQAPRGAAKATTGQRVISLCPSPFLRFEGKEAGCLEYRDRGYHSNFKENDNEKKGLFVVIV